MNSVVHLSAVNCYHLLSLSIITTSALSGLRIAIADHRQKSKLKTESWKQNVVVSLCLEKVSSGVGGFISAKIFDKNTFGNDN